MKNLILVSLLLLTGTVMTHAQAIKAKVTGVTGDATVTMPGSDKALPLSVGETLPAGSVVRTGPGAQVLLSPFPGLGAVIKPNSSVSINKLSYKTNGSTVENRAADLRLHTGTIIFALNPGLEKVTDFKIHAGGAVAAARGCSGIVTIGDNGDATITDIGGSFSISFPAGTTPGVPGTSYGADGKPVPASTVDYDSAQDAINALVASGVDLTTAQIEINSIVNQTNNQNSNNPSDKTSPTQKTIDESSQSGGDNGGQQQSTPPPPPR